ncbi:MAG: hypothetical protein GYA55_12655 [SAR324 cluster bacterium]|uniref:Uncharacterized protein n=1 Tax=SAR324 cluster bacterium TaxID=2024889 RepID=A0A7X9FTT1_9DELT|nr:hypothetical protein [SAR324 cluster bacterium]
MKIRYLIALLACTMLVSTAGTANANTNICKSKIRGAKAAVKSAERSVRSATSLVRKKEQKLTSAQKKAEGLSDKAIRKIDQLNRKVERFALKYDKALVNKENKLARIRDQEEETKARRTWGLGACLLCAAANCKPDNTYEYCASEVARAETLLQALSARRKTIEKSEDKKIETALKRLNKATEERDKVAAEHSGARYNVEAIAAAEEALRQANLILDTANAKLADAERKYEEVLASCPTQA